MIKSFAGKARRWPPAELQRAALRKLAMLNDAAQLSDLAGLPGNRLEPLRGERVGQYSILINDRCRICFRWQDGHSYEVEIVDYH